MFVYAFYTRILSNRRCAIGTTAQRVADALVVRRAMSKGSSIYIRSHIYICVCVCVCVLFTSHILFGLTRGKARHDGLYIDRSIYIIYIYVYHYIYITSRIRSNRRCAIGTTAHLVAEASVVRRAMSEGSSPRQASVPRRVVQT